ncbi:transmembrane protein 276-like [Lepisosteus oculatus]|uniref:transmembrane protein 276-like n=1 Tax=Lepisosteus oculatus TaxID=7918 RepID=UPI0003EA8952|nr:PREDICTED: uncharacterized protein LOC102696200 [Lepisosteus oculatus]
MAESPVQWIISISNLILFLSSLYSARQLVKDHRAPALGFFLLASCAAVGVLPASSPALEAFRWEAAWASWVLSPALVTFGFLWLSEDRSTAYTLLGGATLLTALCDWLSEEGVAVMSRCVALSSLACSLTVCLFTTNHAGALGSLALSLPALLTPGVRGQALIPLITVEASEVILNSLMSLGSFATERALCKYLQELKGQS